MPRSLILAVLCSFAVVSSTAAQGAGATPDSSKASKSSTAAPRDQQTGRAGRAAAPQPATLPPSGAMTSGGAIGAHALPETGERPATPAAVAPIGSGGATGQTTITGGPQ